MAKTFDGADFYITCATIIPVLFFAVAVQGRTYETLLRTALAMAQARRGEQRWTRQVRPYLTSRILQLTAYAIWVAGAVGEFLAITVLYEGYQQPGDRQIVLAATLLLVTATAAGPLGTYVGVRDELDKLGFPPQLAASGKAIEDQQSETQPQAVARDTDAPLS